MAGRRQTTTDPDLAKSIVAAAFLLFGPLVVSVVFCSFHAAIQFVAADGDDPIVSVAFKRKPAQAKRKGIIVGRSTKQQADLPQLSP